jgi:uncharacterized protein (TIGR04255 family)
LPEIQHLRNAPIVEALIDVRVEVRPGFRGEEFRAVGGRLAADYPKIEERAGVTLQLAFGGPQPTQQVQQHGLSGVFLHSADGKNVAQFRTDGFTLNRLEPYTSWDELLPEALRLFEIYVSVAKPRLVTRVATRYINRLQLPNAAMQEFLTSPPRGVPGTQGILAGFLEVSQVEEPTGEKVNFTQASDGNPATQSARAVAIDIDCYREDSFEPSVHAVREQLQRLHALKNRVFFGALTEAALRPYQ